MWKVEFQSLEVRHWVKVCGLCLGPVWLKGVSEGVSECSGRALGEGVGAGLGLCMVGGRLRGQSIRPRGPTGFPMPKWRGKVLAVFPSIPLFPSPRISPIPTGPLSVVGSGLV